MSYKIDIALIEKLRSRSDIALGWEGDTIVVPMDEIQYVIENHQPPAKEKSMFSNCLFAVVMISIGFFLPVKILVGLTMLCFALLVFCLALAWIFTPLSAIYNINNESGESE